MTSPAASLKALYTQGEVRKKDVFSVPLHKLEFEPGFNLRDEGPELEEHIESMTQYILAGGTMPPLEVRVSEGRVLVVEGHCRTRAYRLANERGASIEDVTCIPFTGNDVARVVKMIASSQGKALTSLETANGYARLIAFGKEPQEIAASVGKTRQHVEQLLILANANSDVHALVKSGSVSASVAIDAVRKHGEGAGAFLAAKYGEAKAAGKSKVTAGAINGKPLPREVVDTTISAMDSFMDALPNQARERLAAIESGSLPEGQEVSVSASALLSLLNAHASVQEARAKQEQRARDKAAKAAQTEIEGA
ncbi:ParB-like nuclease domain [Bordetella phage PY223]